MNYTLDNVASFQGTYSGSTTYAQGDIVAYNSSSYVSLINSNTGNEPDTSPSDWTLLAAQGATGATGATGPAGPGMRYAIGTSATISLTAGTYRVDAVTDSGGGSNVGISGSFTGLVGPLPGFEGWNVYIITLSSTQVISITNTNNYGLLLATPVTS